MPNDPYPHKDHRTRLREKATQEPDTLADHELLELLLFEPLSRQDTNPVAHSLLRQYGDLNGFLNGDAEKAAAALPEDGSTAQFLATVRALCRRYLYYQKPGCNTFHSLRSARAHLFESIRPQAEISSVTAVTLSKALERKSTREYATEGAEPITLIREIAAAALAEYSTYIFLVFSHPDGFLTLSAEETAMITGLSALCRREKLVLADAIVQNCDGSRVLAETGLFPPGTFLEF
jgi:DNA repair protein RadC